MGSEPTGSDMKSVADRAVRAFADQFDAEPTHAAVAPGRVSLMGEHTDYNDGLVLSMAIDRYTVVTGRVNRSHRCRVIAADVDGGEMSTFIVDAHLAAGRTVWANYVKGVVAQFLSHGQSVPPFDAAIASGIPMSVGLGSSAAVEVATATLIESLLGIRLAPGRKAEWCREAEREFVGTPRRLMGQISASQNPRGGALMIDCRTLATRAVRIDEQAIAFVVADTGVRHDLVIGEHVLRRDQCDAATAALRDRFSHIRSLRDAKLNELIAVRDTIDPIAFRRARHIVLENQRVQMTADALDSAYYETAGFLMYESHRSLRDDFEVSCAELDMLVRLAREIPGVYGARMTGSGFGGCTVTLCRADVVDDVVRRLGETYHLHTGNDADRFAVSPVGPARSTLFNRNTP
ncbi:MAG: galactokinase [Phycisphaera sp.]|nr:galactokinase [Phycisphaera sp.]